MAQILTDIPSLVFPNELDRIEIGTGQTDEKSCSLSITVDGANVLDTTLWFDTGGRVAVEDLASLIYDQIRGNDFHAVHVEIDVSDSTGSTSGKECILIPCRVALSETAEDFCRMSFLSLASEKQTTASDTEYFSIFTPMGGDVPTNADIELLLLDKTGQIMTRTKRMPVEPPEDECSPQTFGLKIKELIPPEDSHELVSVSVRVGEREKVLRVVAAPYGSMSLEFLNAFGCRETIRVARVEREVKPTRSAAFMGGHYRNYLVMEQTTFHGMSLPLLDGELPLIDDLVHTLRLWRVKDGAELAVTDEEWKYTTEANEMPRCTVSWRETGRMSSIRHSDHSTRIFDDTFDRTYQ